jgi:putative chromate ion transporter
MHRDLVERRKWISESDYKEGLTLAQLMPGPLAAQLAIYLGYVHYGVLGATLLGLGFELPSFLVVLALGWAYQEFGGLAWMQAVFYGVGASVIGIITLSAYKLTTKTVGKDWVLWIVYLTSAGVTVVTESEMVLLFLATGLIRKRLAARHSEACLICDNRRHSLAIQENPRATRHPRCRCYWLGCFPLIRDGKLTLVRFVEHSMRRR